MYLNYDTDINTSEGIKHSAFLAKLLSSIDKIIQINNKTDILLSKKMLW